MAINRRLIFWLLKAYFKKWRRSIFLFFLLGLGCFFLLRFSLPTIIAKFPLIQKETIGVVGAYTVDTLPSFILQDVAEGLTKIDDTDTPRPDLASSWDIQDNGKTYVFHLKPHVHFTDGTELTSKEINFSFSDVTVKRPNDATIVFHIKESYAPFLVTLSRPVIKQGFIGIGSYRIKDITLNGTFIESLTLSNVDQPFKIKIYQFYPTQESLRIAFVLGNVTQAVGLTDLSFKNTSLDRFPNDTVTKTTNYNQLVTLFYNTQDTSLSDKRLRDALSYSLPNSFIQGERDSSPFPPKSWAYQSDFLRTQDIDHAKLLLQTVQSGAKGVFPTLTISTLPRYSDVAQKIAESWKAIGIQTNIKVVTSIPNSFEISLGNFNVPKDPDQYTLWHSNQQNNITSYSNLRIDKLLEDGRKTTNQQDRLKIYSDFQKYLLDDQPASFLYFPYTYTVTRK